jgi:hypothetical protein
VAETDAVRFHGGRCNARWEQRYVTDLRDGHTTCLGQRYDVHEVQPSVWLAVLPGVKVSAAIPAATAHNATKAWNRAMHSMNVTLPNHLARAKQARLALLRSARR